MRYKRFLIDLLIIIVTLLMCFPVLAEVPPLISYQGMLKNTAGNPLTGTYSIQFTIYDAATDGNQLWTETQTATISQGILNILLGSSSPIAVDVLSGTKIRYPIPGKDTLNTNNNILPVRCNHL